jgi:hypothetical protein
MRRRKFPISPFTYSTPLHKIYRLFFCSHILLKILQIIFQRFLSSKTKHHVVCWMSVDVKKNEESDSVCWLLHVGLLLALRTLQPRIYKRHVRPKCQLTFNGLHSVVSQKIELFVTTAMETSNSIFFSNTLKDKSEVYAF